MLLRFNNAIVSASFRTPYCGDLRHEHGALRGSLRGGGTESELALIELIDDLAHGSLIQIGRSSQRSLRLCGGRDRRNCGRRRDENVGCPALAEPAAVRKHAKIMNPTAESSLLLRKAHTWRLTLASVAESMADLVIFMRLFLFSDLNEVRFLLAQLLCQQTYTSLTF